MDWMEGSRATYFQRWSQKKATRSVMRNDISRIQCGKLLLLPEVYDELGPCTLTPSPAAELLRPICSQQQFHQPRYRATETQSNERIVEIPSRGGPLKTGIRRLPVLFNDQAPRPFSHSAMSSRRAALLVPCHRITIAPS